VGSAGGQGSKRGRTDCQNVSMRLPPTVLHAAVKQCN
jgi:hypothetical protein